MQELFQFSVKNFVSVGSGTEVMTEKHSPQGARRKPRLLLPVSAVDHTSDSVAEVQDVEVDQQAYVQAAKAHV